MSDAAVAPNRPLRVLIVEDEDMFAAGLAVMLAEYPMLVVVGRAADGVEGIALVDALRPDVALMDITMPRGDGITATRAIRKFHPGTAVVVLSSLHDAETAVHARAAGAAAYLFKGCSIDQVVAAVLEVAAPAAAPTELSPERSRPLRPRPLRAAAHGA
jgi:DNA-binding NarL/FixJ family response regulator